MTEGNGFDLWAGGYDEKTGFVKEETRYPAAGFKRVMAALFRKTLQHGAGNVLQIGFGSGLLTVPLHRHGCRIWGQDFAQRMVESTQPKVRDAQLYCGSFTDGLVPELKQQTYDVIVVSYALQNLTDEQRLSFVRELLNQLRPGGLMLIGDVMFQDRAALEECRDSENERWDDTVNHLVVDEWEQRIGRKVTFEKTSYCSGVLIVEPKAAFTLNRMHEIQRELQARYFDKWGGLSPEHGVRSLLWMMGEAGEVADIIKKKGETSIMTDPEVRHDFVEEMCDVMMYFNDLMLCYGITPEEMQEVYEAKHRRNMKRW